MARKKKSTVVRRTYTLAHELIASPTSPTPPEIARSQLTRIWDGLANLESAPYPTPRDWRLCSDAVNLLETLVTEGVNPVRNDKGNVIASHWLDCDGDLVEVADSSGLLQDAIAALAVAGERHKAGSNLRLDGAGIVAVRSVLENYADMLAALPQRTMVRVHRLTEKRISEILHGKKRPSDVAVINI